MSDELCVIDVLPEQIVNGRITLRLPPGTDKSKLKVVFAPPLLLVAGADTTIAVLQSMLKNNSAQAPTRFRLLVERIAKKEGCSVDTVADLIRFCPTIRDIQNKYPGDGHMGVRDKALTILLEALATLGITLPER